jgi:FixJ family two-component response regulator
MISCSEKQLMQLVVAGASDEQIASCLDLSTKRSSDADRPLDEAARSDRAN